MASDSVFGQESNEDTKLVLKLYVTGMSGLSMKAIKNIKLLCDKYVKGKFDLEVIDLYKFPEAAHQNQVVFSPSLVRVSPLPRRLIIGTLSDEERLLKLLNIAP